jgi:predicted DNA binding protein
MWIAKLKLKHNSRIANRAKEYNISCHSILMGKPIKNKVSYVSGLHYLVGDEENIKKFARDLKKDKGVKELELKGNVFSMLETAKGIPSYHLETNIFFVKPVLSNNDGFEYWEIASWSKQYLIKFIEKLEKSKIQLEILKLYNSKLDEIHFPKIMPRLTKKQKRAIELAISNGYYKYPRKVNLDKLADEMGIGISTFQEHLRKAENKILPLFSDFE